MKDQTLVNGLQNAAVYVLVIYITWKVLFVGIYICIVVFKFTCQPCMGTIMYMYINKHDVAGPSMQIPNKKWSHEDKSLHLFCIKNEI